MKIVALNCCVRLALVMWKRLIVTLWRWSEWKYIKWPGGPIGAPDRRKVAFALPGTCVRSDIRFDPVCDIEVVAGVCYQQQQFARSSSSIPVAAAVFCWIMKACIHLQSTSLHIYCHVFWELQLHCLFDYFVCLFVAWATCIAWATLSCIGHAIVIWSNCCGPVAWLNENLK